MKLDVVEIDNDPMSIPCCPLCDNGIQAGEPIVIVNASGAIGLAHEFCVEDFKS